MYIYTYIYIHLYVYIYIYTYLSVYTQNIREVNVKVSEEELQKRRDAWIAPPLKATRGALYKYIKCVSSASTGCVTDE